MDDGCLAASLSSEIDRIKSLKRRITRVEEARKALAADANDAKANLTVGSWECFVMENWEEGLPYLTKAAGSAEVAKLDLTNPDETDALARIGDGWWKLSESKKGDERQHLRARAKLRYKQALQDATGFARAKLKKRLFAKGILHHALQFDGQTSRVEVQDFGYGGSRPLTNEAVVQPQRAAPQAGRSSRQTIFSNGLSAGLRLEISHGWNFRFWYQKSPRKWSLTSVSSQRRVDYDHWTHVAAVYDPQTNQIRLYVNGQPQTPRTVSGPHRPSNSPFYIGAAPSARGRSPAYYFRGMVRSLRVSSSARYTPLVEAPDELEADRSTVLLFKFDEGKGDHLKNSAGGKVVGRILNCKWVETE